VSIPASHCTFLERAVERLRDDPRILGVAAAGSYATGTMDEFSDLDLVVGVEPDGIESLNAARRELAASLGPLVAAFTGEHVGEPRLLICLYAGETGRPPLHVDLKFVALGDLGPRVDEPVVLWERDTRFRPALLQGTARWPTHDSQWIEDRFWIWVHYCACRIGRGELFEAIDFLAFLRSQVLGPLALLEAGAAPAGVRRLESRAPGRANSLEATIPAYEVGSCVRSLIAAADVYRSLRDGPQGARVTPNRIAERVALDYAYGLIGGQRDDRATATGPAVADPKRTHASDR
jgi:predicted nucleotidyltransferase